LLPGLLLAAALAGRAPAAPDAAKPAPDAADDERKMEFRAADMLNRGAELLEAKQEERGLKMIQAVPQMFPKTKARFRAYLAIGRFQMGKRQYDLALKPLEQLAESEDPQERAEGLYQLGICKYERGNYDGAFADLRRVTVEYPWSVFANEAYYYIGQCHFKLGHWAKAIEALEMVGTSVPAETQGEAAAEAGQRIYIKVLDKNLVVLNTDKEKVKVLVAARSGDKEEVLLQPFGKSGEYWLGSIQTVLGEPAAGDGVLEISGGDEVTVAYVNRYTSDGKVNQQVLAKVKMVSTASVGFTDGAFREYTKGVIADEPAFLRVKDMNRSVGKEPGRVSVKVSSRYKPHNDAKDKPAAQTEGQEDRWETRDTADVILTETGSRTGIFTASLTPHVPRPDESPAKAAGRLLAAKGDEIVVEYVNEISMVSRDPRTISASAKLLMGQFQDVKIEQRVVDSIDLKVRKNLIEAKIYLKLGQIFKEVGLVSKAAEKADEGLARVNEVISAGMKASLDRALIEEAFSIKWDLLLVKDNLGQAIDVCRTLTQLFPDSSLVDRALLKIGQAKLEAGSPGEAIGIFNAVLALPKSDLKPEALFNIAVVMEKRAVREAELRGQEPVLADVMVAYKRVADTYPDSAFAGDALDKVANYYIATKDYDRAIGMMERVFQDYPDVKFLDVMLYKWEVAAYRKGDFATAKAKAEQLLAEYPNSKLAEKARKDLETISKKLNP
jgi:TolA-binding protein